MTKVADETISNQMKERLKFEGDAGIVPDDIFHAHVEEGFFDSLAKVQETQQKLTTALQRAFGEGAIDHMAANKDIPAVSGEVKFGTNTINLNVRRERSYPAPSNAADKAPVIVHGDTVVGVRVMDDGGIRATREHLKGYARNAFK